ncbi:MAG TPA: type II secretion system protein [Phycisphaerales bacterium]|nr:type II secretion system protein [Phycisphaerales bacterium]HMP36618.1 type II secretion system protein [Phycisphaerales bacterium]
MLHPSRHPRRPVPSGVRGRRAAGFTLVEMLVTVAVIIVLVTILLGALTLGGRRAQATRTAFLMSSIGQALVRFREDHGYLPPILGRRDFAAAETPTGLPMIAGRERDAINPPDPNSNGFGTDLQAWYSETSLAEYLLGYGDRTQDGYGIVGDVTQVLSQFPGSFGAKETPPLGIRSPGFDGVWGAWTNPRSGFAADGSLEARNLTGFVSTPPASAPIAANNDRLEGRVYGPYLELRDGSAVGRIDVNGNVVFPGDETYDERRPAVIADAWGEPIRYYRRGHVPREPKAIDARINLGDVFALRPWSFGPGEEAFGLADGSTDMVSQLPGGGTVVGDNATARALQSADFALLSSGPDKQWSRLRRADPAERNKDNIVEVGR